MTFARITLWFAVVTFGAFGILLTASPGLLDKWLGLRATTPEASTELRGFYGGLEIGLAVFLAVCALRPSFTAPGCLALALLCGGIAAARLLGFALDGSASPKLFAFLGTELLFVVLGTISVLRLR